VSRAGQTAAALADSVRSVTSVTGIGVLTFHWWDFLMPDGSWCGEFARFTVELLRRCADEAPVTFSTVAAFADVAGRS
jgi:hypothetical protein